MPFANATPDPDWSLTTHIPSELIATIFVWINPGEINYFRSICRLLNEILTTPHFRKLNVSLAASSFTIRPIFALLTQQNVLIRYVFLDNPSKRYYSWETDFVTSNGGISFRSKERGIIAIAKRIASRWSLDPKTVYTASIFRCPADAGHHLVCLPINGKDQSRRGPDFFDPKSELLVFLPKQAYFKPPKDTALKFTVSVPLTKCRLLFTRLGLSYTIYPFLSSSIFIYIDALTDAEGCISVTDLYWLMQHKLRPSIGSSFCLTRIPAENRLPHNLAPLSRKFNPGTDILVLIPQDSIPVDPLLGFCKQIVIDPTSNSDVEKSEELLALKMGMYSSADPRIFDSLVELADCMLVNAAISKCRVIVRNMYDISHSNPSHESMSSLFEIISNVVNEGFYNSLEFTLPDTPGSLEFIERLVMLWIKLGKLSDAASVVNGVARVLREEGRFGESDRIYSSYFSNIHLDITNTDDLSCYCDALEGLAILRFRQDRFSESFSRISEVLTTRRTTFADNTSAISRVMSNFRIILFQLSEFEVLLPLLLTHYHELLQKEDPKYLRTLLRAGICYSYLGRMDEARPLLLQYVDASKISGKELDIATVGALRHLGSTYEVSDPLKAEELYHQVLERYTVEPGNDNVRIHSIERSLGSLWLNMGMYEKAETIWVKVLADRRKYLRLNDPALLYCLEKLGLLYDTMQQFEKAEACYREHVCILESDEWHLPYQLVKSHIQLAAHMFKRKDCNGEAIDALRKAYIEYTRVDTLGGILAYSTVEVLFERIFGSCLDALAEDLPELSQFLKSRRLVAGEMSI
ncbi:UNVERIFIED_CONTAM: hypothetical protein HDU68_003141 [Siphonaria sp. JEL0065]|nr:hypothetical protein HDU68_003141 [Siphonaria sp. JEL0065]